MMEKMMLFYAETGELCKVLFFNAECRICACLYLASNGDVLPASWLRC